MFFECIPWIIADRWTLRIFRLPPDCHGRSVCSSHFSHFHLVLLQGKVKNQLTCWLNDLMTWPRYANDRLFKSTNEPSSSVSADWSRAELAVRESSSLFRASILTVKWICEQLPSMSHLRRSLSILNCISFYTIYDCFRHLDPDERFAYRGSGCRRLLQSKEPDCGCYQRWKLQVNIYRVFVGKSVPYRPISCLLMCLRDFSHSTRLLAATTLRNVLGTKDLTEILSERETISHLIQSTLDEATEPWGVQVERVEMWD